MTTLERANNYLKKSIDCIDSLDIETVTSAQEIDKLKALVSNFILKLKSKKINLSGTDIISIIDNDALIAIMNQMIEYAELNFSNQLDINGDDDIIKTIATTVNLLGEELNDKIKQLQELNITLKVTTEENEVKGQELHGVMKALDNSALIFIIDSKYKIIKVNKTACDISGYAENELIGDNGKIAIFDYYPDQFWNTMRNTLESGKMWRNEIICLTKTGKEFWLDTIINPITNIKGEITHYLSIGNLITEKKIQEFKLIESERAIRQSLTEKETLLQELHHRVKNNLQMIAGLMEMQIKRTEHAEVIEQLTESQNRVMAMAFLHEKLYKFKNISNVNISEYTTSLISSFSSMYGENKNKGYLIKVEHTIEQDIYINISRAIPYGLIFNEIISNCYKHAFSNEDNGTIRISLIKDEDKIYLKIKDSGKGIKNLNFKNVKTLGVKLITSLAAQLKAEVSFKNEKGLEVCVNF